MAFQLSVQNFVSGLFRGKDLTTFEKIFSCMFIYLQMVTPGEKKAKSMWCKAQFLSMYSTYNPVYYTPTKELAKLNKIKRDFCLTASTVYFHNFLKRLSLRNFFPVFVCAYGKIEVLHATTK